MEYTTVTTNTFSQLDKAIHCEQLRPVHNPSCNLFQHQEVWKLYLIIDYCKKIMYSYHHSKQVFYCVILEDFPFVCSCISPTNHHYPKNHGHAIMSTSIYYVFQVSPLSCCRWSPLSKGQQLARKRYNDRWAGKQFM